MSLCEELDSITEMVERMEIKTFDQTMIPFIKSSTREVLEVIGQYTLSELASLEEEGVNKMVFETNVSLKKLSAYYQLTVKEKRELAKFNANQLQAIQTMVKEDWEYVESLTEEDLT